MSAMSSSRQQAFIDAPVSVVWDLLADVERHPEWWPRVVEVECEGLEEGCTYRQVMRGPVGTEELDLQVEGLDDCERLAIRCLSTGTFVTFALTEAQNGTFVDSEFGMDPHGFGHRVFDAIAGKRYFRAWMRQTIDALNEAARRRAGASA